MCVAAVRGALEPLPGVTKVEIKKDDPNFKVTYDPAKVKVDDLLEILSKKNEPAKKKGS